MKESDVLKNYRQRLLKKEGVVAVGLGYKKVKGKKTKSYGIVCSVARKLPLSKLAKKDVVPAEVGGVVTDVVEKGVIRALKARTDRWRPAPGGVSIGHEWITAGTLGCLVEKEGEVYILSNNHVLADSNNAPIGSAILQPGKHDGGTLIDRIAALADFVPINFTGLPDGCKIGNGVANVLNFLAKLVGSKSRLKLTSIRQIENLVDAAIAQPISDGDVATEILEIGTVLGVDENVLVGREIQKSGRTTELTRGEIEQIEVTTSVQYGEGKIAIFTDQFMAGAMCSGGDSGSAVLDVDRNLIGLLFAGSENSTIINPIRHVLELLGIRPILE